MAPLLPFIHRKIVVLRSEATAAQAARAICSHSIGCVVVSDHEAHIVGILTDRDLACSLGTSLEEPSSVPIGQIMTTPVVTASDTDELEHVIQLMTTYGIRRVPIVQLLSRGRQRCVGLVTLDDLVASKSISEYLQIRIVKSQLRRRIQGILHTSEDIAFSHKQASAFLHGIAVQAGLPGLPGLAVLTEDRARQAVRVVLESLIRRLHHTAAMHLIGILPESLQEELRDVPSGPDWTVTVPMILRDLEEMLETDEERACAALARICEALDGALNAQHFAHVKAQLPEDIAALFYQRPRAA